jgi:TfoX-like protein
MAYDEDLAQRVRTALSRRRGVSEKKMFGGLCFMVGDAMCCGIVRDELMARVGPERYDKALAEPGARPMDFSGKPMVGFVFVGGPGIQSAAALGKWMGWCAEFASALPPKKKRSRATSRRPRR